MRIDYDFTASFDVDAQKGFTPLCPDELPVPDGHTIVAALNNQAKRAAFRVGSKDAHSPHAKWITYESPLLSPVEGHPHMDVHWHRHCEVGTTGFELLDGLPHPMDYDFFVYKGVERDVHPYGACYHTLDWRIYRRSTGVIEFLHSRRMRTVIVGGLALDYCVKETALQLYDAGFDVIVNLAACRGIDQCTIDAALDEMRSLGIVIVDQV